MRIPPAAETGLTFSKPHACLSFYLLLIWQYGKTGGTTIFFIS
jgi:hypothetical protein